MLSDRRNITEKNGNKKSAKRMGLAAVKDSPFKVLEAFPPAFYFDLNKKYRY